MTEFGKRVSGRRQFQITVIGPHVFYRDESFRQLGEGRLVPRIASGTIIFICLCLSPCPNRDHANQAKQNQAIPVIRDWDHPGTIDK